MALSFSEQPPTYTLQERIEQLYNSLLMAHNFFHDLDQLYNLTQQFKNIIFEAVARNALSGSTQAKSPKFDLEKVRSLYPNVETYDYMERQRRLFEQVRFELMKNYEGQFVRFEDGHVLDVGSTRRELIRRAPLNKSPFGVFIEQVTSSPRRSL